MNNRIMISAPDALYDAMSQGATDTLCRLDASPDSWTEETFRGAQLWVDGYAADLAEKKARLAHIGRVAPKLPVLTDSVSVLLAAQARWNGGKNPLWGFDSLLWMSGGKTQTIAGTKSRDLDRLMSSWPELSWVPIQDAIGLAFARTVVPMINEAVGFLAQGLAPEMIDRGVVLALNYPQGLLAWADRLGWPVVYEVMRSMEHAYGPQYRPHPWILGRLGISRYEEGR